MEHEVEHCQGEGVGGDLGEKTCVEQEVEGEGREDGLGEKTCVWSTRLNTAKETVLEVA